jgi:hypothetical protein
MDDSELALRYMLAWVRLHSAAAPDAWSGQQVVDAYAILPRPPVRLADWASAIGAKTQEPPGVPIGAGTFKILEGMASPKGPADVQHGE